MLRDMLGHVVQIVKENNEEYMEQVSTESLLTLVNEHLHDVIRMSNATPTVFQIFLEY